MCCEQQVGSRGRRLTDVPAHRHQGHAAVISAAKRASRFFDRVKANAAAGISRTGSQWAGGRHRCSGCSWQRVRPDRAGTPGWVSILGRSGEKNPPGRGAPHPPPGHVAFLRSSRPAVGRPCPERWLGEDTQRAPAVRQPAANERRHRLSPVCRGRVGAATQAAGALTATVVFSPRQQSASPDESRFAVAYAGRHQGYVPDGCRSSVRSGAQMTYPRWPPARYDGQTGRPFPLPEPGRAASFCGVRGGTGWWAGAGGVPAHPRKVPSTHSFVVTLNSGTFGICLRWSASLWSCCWFSR